MEHPAAYAPKPPDPTPEQRLLLMNDKSWELFIERCVRQLQKEGVYAYVQHLGGAGDKGRDVCGYTQEGQPEEGKWDLYQGKFYATSLSPSEFAPELVKFLTNVFDSTYPRPRNYYVCALKLGTTLFDMLRHPARMRAWILKTWTEKGFKPDLSNDLIAFIDAFPFDIILNKPPADLLDIHGRDAAMHWQHFGVLGSRDPNPAVPVAPTADELKYVKALLDVYSEQTSATVTEVAAISPKYQPHFAAQRRLFYSAEGLNRFSRDKLPGAFDDLLSQVELGIGTVLTTPHTDGLSKLHEALRQASSLQVTANPLNARLEGGDLQGACHHLANQERAKWVEDGKK